MSTIGLFAIASASDKQSEGGDGKSLSTRLAKAVSVLKNVLLLIGLGTLLLAIALAPLLSLLLDGLGKWDWPWRYRLFKWLNKRFGPALQIEPFEDSAMASRLGPGFALLIQARVEGGRETGSHLYLVTGEERTGNDLAALQGLPQTQALAVALSLLRLLWRRGRLAVTGSLLPIDDGKTAAVTLSLRRNSKLVNTTELWLGEPPTHELTPPASNRVLAVAAAGWVEHTVIDETPGQSARELLLSHDARSWALFRAGAELNRMSLLGDAADLYERALAIDDNNIGALIDLAHLRRLDHALEGAKALACAAITLIQKRNALYRQRRDDEDPNWYRAKIVLITTLAERAKELRGDGNWPDANCVRQEAYDLAVVVARTAVEAQDTVEEIVGEGLEDIEHGGKLGFRDRWRAASRARKKKRSFDLRRAVELHLLLRTTTPAPYCSPPRTSATSRRA